MALVFHSGLETGDFSEWDSTTGSPTLVTGIDTIEQLTGTDALAIYGTVYKGQTFTTVGAITINFVELSVKKSGSPPGDLEIAIQGVDGSADPDNSDIATGSLSAGRVTGSFQTFKIPITSVALDATTQYAIVCRQAGDAGDVSNRYDIAWEISGSPYAGGIAKTTNDGGGTWTNASGSDDGDIYFRIGRDVNTGDYAMRCNTTAQQAFVTSSTGALTEGAVNFNLYITDAPDTECIIIGTESPGFGSLRLNTDRTLELYDNATSRGSSAALDLGKWYRVCYSFDTGTNATVFLDGVDVINTGSASTNLAMQIGVITSCTADLYFDDVSIDSSDISEADLDDIRVQVALPVGDGNQNDYDQTSGFALCDNLPDDTDYVRNNQDSTNREQFQLTTMTTLGISGATPQAINIIVRQDRAGGGGTVHSTNVRDNATDFETANTVPQAWTQFSKYYATLPSGGGAWTEARFDALEAGVFHDGGQNQYCSTVNVMLAYIPAAGGPVALAGAVDAVSSVTGSLSVAKKIAGAVDAVSSVTGSLSVAKKIAGTVDAVSSVTGSLSVAKKIAGTVDAVSSVTGSLSVAKKIAGSVDAVSSVTGSLTVTSEVLLAGSVDAVSSVTGSLSVAKKIAGTVDAVSSVTGSLSRTRGLIGDVAAVSSVTGNLTVLVSLAGNIAAVSAVAGEIGVARRLIGEVRAISAVTGKLNMSIALIGEVQALSMLSGTLTIPARGSTLPEEWQWIADLIDEEGRGMTITPPGALTDDSKPWRGNAVGSASDATGVMIEYMAEPLGGDHAMRAEQKVLLAPLLEINVERGTKITDSIDDSDWFVVDVEKITSRSDILLYILWVRR